MVRNFVSEILDIIQRTPNKKDGIKNVVLSLDKFLDEADNDTMALVSQRRILTNLFRQYIDLYKLMSGEDLLSAEQIVAKERLPIQLRPEDKLREEILSRASELNRRFGKVPQIELLKKSLEKEDLILPWKNPNSVIATILMRSGLWEKKEDGSFVEKTAE